jgi:pyruvate,water dikinase
MLMTLEQMDPAEGQERFGWKAANLARLLRAGLPVPAGFVIGQELDDEALEALEKEIMGSFASLACASVAVRSSMSLEDGREATFAGMLESSINVTLRSLMDSIRQCRQSVHAPRVLRYCRLRRIDPGRLRTAVIVQAMIDTPSLSGILFTRDPTGRTEGMVLEAAPGSCDAVTLGRAPVVRHFLDRRTGRSRSASGALAGTGPGALDRRLMADLAKMGRKIEAMFGCPQDVEWSCDRRGDPWILQARPITPRAARRAEGTG